MYATETVEKLLLAFFNNLWGGRPEHAPDDDMPKAKANPKLSGSWMAHKVDLERAWKFCGFGWPEEHALYMRYGRELTVAETAREMNMTKRAIQQLTDAAVADLVEEMNTGTKRRAARDDADQTREIHGLYTKAFA